MDSINILIPMAGLGSRFADAGYEKPKPLIDVNGIPMIKAAIDSLNISGNYIFVVQKDHYSKYNLFNILNDIVPDCQIVQVNGLTDGAARTTLMAKDFINNDNPLVIANSDQIVEWDPNKFLELFLQDADGAIAIFKSKDPKWSFAKIKNNRIIEVAEKIQISDNATAGIYGWSKGADYVRYAEQMISKNITTNNEYYVCPVYNEAILDGKTVLPYFIQNMHSLGTPEDLEQVIKNDLYYF